MQRRPSHSALLEALAQFLVAEIGPAVTDKKLAFRVLIAANLAQTLATEVRGETARVSEELESLQAILPDVIKGDARAFPARERESALDLLNEQLAIRLRKGTLTQDLYSQTGLHLKKTLLASLAVLNPRFETQDDLGDEG